MFSFQNFKTYLYPVCKQSHTAGKSNTVGVAWINESGQKSQEWQFKDIQWQLCQTAGLCACMCVHEHKAWDVQGNPSSDDLFFIMY